MSDDQESLEKDSSVGSLVEETEPLVQQATGSSDPDALEFRFGTYKDENKTEREVNHYDYGNMVRSSSKHSIGDSSSSKSGISNSDDPKWLRVFTKKCTEEWNPLNNRKSIENVDVSQWIGNHLDYQNPQALKNILKAVNIDDVCCRALK